MAFTKPQNGQGDCPLFAIIPTEIRDQILDLAITPYAPRSVIFPTQLRYNRPGFRESNRSLSTSLLRTCQRIHAETVGLPVRKYVGVDWLCHDDSTGKRASFPSKMQNLHLYTEAYQLSASECKVWGICAKRISIQGG